MANTKITSNVISDDIALGGNPTTTTQSAGNNTTRIATTAFVKAAIDATIDSAPGALDTLNELAAAIGDDANFSTTITNSIATKAPLASPSLTGTVTITGDFPQLYFVDSAGTDLDAYVVNNANGLFFGKTNSPSASNDILSLNLSDKSATFAGNVTVPYLATTSYIDLNNSGNRGKIGWSGNHTYIATTSSVGSIIFKNNVSSTAAPQTGGDTLLTLADGGDATFAGTISSGAHTLTTGDLTINDDEGKIRFASSLNWDIQPETDDASLRIKTSSGSNREVIFENTGSGVLGLDVEGGLKLGTSLEIVTSSAAEISLTGNGAGNLVAANDLYIMAGSGTSSGNLYLGSEGGNAQVTLDGGQLTTQGITAVSTGNYSTGNVGLIAKSVSNRGTVRVRSDSDTPAELFFDVNGGIRWDFSSRSSSSNYDLLLYPQHSTPALNAVGGHIFRFTQTGHLGIGTNTSGRSGLDVDGAVTSSNSDNDLGTHTYSTYASRVLSGRIDVTSGYSGTLASGRKFVFKYNASSWKAFHGRITVSGTGGFSSYEFGGYWNNSGSCQTVELQDGLNSSLAFTTSGQAIVLSLTIGQTVVHPCFSVEYNQSGGDGAPRMDRAEFFIQ